VRVLAWMDLEMTGLDPARHVIVEIATLITDDELNIVAEGPDLVIHATEEQLAGMDEVVVAMHTGSGLLDQIRESRISLEEAGAATMEFLRSHIPAPRTVPLGGNSIGMDRRFLAVHLPEIEEYLHYRSVDVSTIKELARRWYPGDLAGFDRKSSSHRAMDDIRESVDELRYWRERVFRSPEPPGGEPASDASTTEQRSDGSGITAGAEPSTGTP
jgi:oligoribonuclease